MAGSFESCQALIGRVKAAGGDAQMLAPPDRGIRGNSHMIMQDRNHLQIADLILQCDQRRPDLSCGTAAWSPSSRSPRWVTTTS